MVLSSTDIQKFKDTYSIIVIASNCSTDAAKDSTLPRDAYLVKCVNSEEVWYDIVMGLKPDIFDAYYDTFGNVIKDITWTDGKVNSKLWGNKPKPTAKK